MKWYALNLLAMSAMVTGASARIGDTPDQLKARYGEPVAQSVDKNGNGLRIYRTAKFKEVRVTFIAGKSQLRKIHRRRWRRPQNDVQRPS